MLGPIVAALLAANAAPTSWNYTFDASAKPEVEVSNIRGRIEVSPSAGSQVKVEGRVDKQGRDAWMVQARKDGDDIRVEVCCGPCEERSHDGRECSEGGVALTVFVPAATRLDVSSVEAPVKISGITGSQKISTVGGNVESTGSEEKLRVSSVSARVRLAPKALGRTEVSTVSGQVDLRLPRDAGAQVSFSTVGGKINGTSFALGSTTRTYGDGKTPIHVSTVGGELNVDQGG